MPCRARSHPLVVAPVKWVRARHHGCGRWRHLGLLRKRVRLLRYRHAACAKNVELVARPGADAREEELPDACTMAQTHRMAARIPAVEIANHRDALRVGRPHGKTRPLHAIDRHHISAERLGEMEMPPFVE